MRFEHPEILFALFLLIIPILVHLFQLRRFKREHFTNLKFLRKAALKTRKSSRIKEWLVLFTRILALAALILAFSQPFLPATDESLLTSETVIYLDNSYSMQAKGPNGSLLKRGIQDLLEHLPKEEPISLFTNDAIYKNVTLETNREDIQGTGYSPKKMDWRTIILTAEDLFKENTARKNLVLISDFQDSNEDYVFEDNKKKDLHLIKLRPEHLNNIAIDTVIAPASGPEETILDIKLSATGNPEQEIPVSIYDGSTLLAKKIITLDDKLVGNSSFKLPAGPITNGVVEIEDSGLLFDNRLFFSSNKPEVIKVAVISGTKDDFLGRIFKAPEFELQFFSESNVDHNTLLEANLIILNEIEEISMALSRNLEKQLEENAFLLIIPSENALSSYKDFLVQMQLPQLIEYIERELKITDISFGHPLYAGVFEEQTTNFQYPKTSSYFRIRKGATPVLSFENGDPFLVQKGNTFLFSAPLNEENSNFQKAPLIVPSLFNIGRMSLPPTQLYYINGIPGEIGLNAELQTDEVLKLVNSGSAFIPQQRRYENKTYLRLDENPAEAGHYEIQRDSITLKTISFNISRKESQLSYHDLSSIPRAEIHEDIAGFFETMKAKKEISPLWKWFVIFALFFLLMETLILKFFK